MQEARRISNQRRTDFIRRNIRENKSLEEKMKDRKKEKAFSESFIAMAKLGNERNFSTAYDIADKLMSGITEDNEYENSKRDLVMKKITSMLEEQYRDAIIAKYNSLFNEVYTYGSKEEYYASGYPGSYEEFSRARAIDKLTSQLAKSRYGGYMHSIVTKVLEEYFSKQRSKSIRELRMPDKSIPKEPLVPDRIKRTIWRKESDER